MSESDLTRAPGPKRSRVVFLRHGQSQWNHDRRYTGWTDVELSRAGRRQSAQAGRLLRDKGLRFDVAFTSVLARARETLDSVLATMGGDATRLETTWRLNERHYGALQGLPKKEALEQFGPERIFRWVRSFDVAPPPFSEAALAEQRTAPLYADVAAGDLPATESLADTLARTLPYWEDTIAPAVRAGLSVLVVAHLNSLRALVTHLESIPPAVVPTLSIHTGEPFVIDFDEDLVATRRHYLRFRPGLALKRLRRKVVRGRQARAWLPAEGARSEV